MPRSFALLIIAANLAQAKQIRAHVGRLSLSYGCHFVKNSEHALDFLQRKAPFEEAPRPDLILLVSRLSGNHGQHVLRSIKSNPVFCRIPVIVTSGQACLGDFGKMPEHRARPLSADGTCVAEIDLRLLDAIDRFWASSMQLPG
jgi:CheY-like chemotaxis protein